jgi:hypothetical protein
VDPQTSLFGAIPRLCQDKPDVARSDDHRKEKELPEKTLAGNIKAVMDGSLRRQPEQGQWELSKAKLSEERKALGGFQAWEEIGTRTR